MKKIFVFALALLMALSLAACAGTSSDKGVLHYYGVLTMGKKTADEMAAMFRDIDLETTDTYTDGTRVDSWRAVYYDDLQSGLLALQKGDIETMNMFRTTADYIIAQNEGQYALGENYAYYDRVLCMALREENTELLEKLNAAIAALDEEGKLKELEERYINTSEPDAMAIPKIEGAETIKVLVTGDQPPYDCVTADGQAAGYNIALLSEISQRIGMNIEPVCASHGARFTALASGRTDVVFCTLGFVKPGGTVTFETDLPDGCIHTEAYTRQPYAGLILAK